MPECCGALIITTLFKEIEECPDPKASWEMNIKITYMGGMSKEKIDAIF